jgi:hypothetical protein
MMSKRKIIVKVPDSIKIQNNMGIVPDDGEFIFQNLCTHCTGDLIYKAVAWTEDNNGLWMVDQIEFKCSNEPDMIDLNEWNEWFNKHNTIQPEIHIKVIDNAVIKWINKGFRFKLS